MPSHCTTRPPPIASRINPIAETPRSAVFDAPSAAPNASMESASPIGSPARSAPSAPTNRINAAIPPTASQRVARRSIGASVGGASNSRNNAVPIANSRSSRAAACSASTGEWLPSAALIAGISPVLSGADRKGEGAADDVTVERRDPPAHQIAPVRQAIRQRPEHLPVAHLRRARRRMVLPRRIDQAQAQQLHRLIEHERDALRRGRVDGVRRRARALQRGMRQRRRRACQQHDEDQRQEPDAGLEPRERAGRQHRSDQCAFGSVTVKPGAGYS